MSLGVINEPYSDGLGECAREDNREPQDGKRRTEVPESNDLGGYRPRSTPEYPSNHACMVFGLDNPD